MHHLIKFSYSHFEHILGDFAPCITGCFSWNNIPNLSGTMHLKKYLEKYFCAGTCTLLNTNETLSSAECHDPNRMDLYFVFGCRGMKFFPRLQVMHVSLVGNSLYKNFLK